MCAPGYVFDGYYCIPAAPWVVPPPQEYPDPEEEAAMALRLQQRLRGRLSLGIQGGLGFLAPKEWTHDSSLITGLAVLWAGYRRNFQPTFGLQVRGGAMLGFAAYNVTYSTSSDPKESDSDFTQVTGALLDVVPYFGPFGRFYVGPMAWLGYISFSDKDLRAGPNGRFALQDGAMYGIGVSGGFVLGQREQIDLNFSTRLDLNSEHKLTLLGMFGVNFHP
jgi:hypothetical protein